MKNIVSCRFRHIEAMQRGLGEAARSWEGSAVLGRQRGLGGSPRRRNLITLSLYGWSAMQMHG